MNATSFTSRRMTPGMLPYCPLSPRPAARRQRRQPLPEVVPVRRAPVAAQSLQPDVFDGTAETEPANVWETITKHAILALVAAIVLLAARGIM